MVRTDFSNSLITQLRTMTLANGYQVEAGTVSKIVRMQPTQSTVGVYPKINYISVDTTDATLTRLEQAGTQENILNWAVIALLTIPPDINNSGTLSDALDVTMKEIERCIYNSTFAQEISIISESRTVPTDTPFGMVVVQGQYFFAEDLNN